jgi:hypothetical protein
MKKLAFGALLVGLLAACGSSGNNKIMLIDSNDVDGMDTCNVLTQTGCNTGEKCTWFEDATTPTPLGHIGCSPDGTAALGAACTYGSPGPTGYDNCVKGNVCVSGHCAQICDQNGGTPGCGSGFACGLYSSLFDVGGMTAAGVCDKTCDPLADNDFDGSGSDTKTGSACTASQGCYGFPGDIIPTHATCTGEFNKTLGHRSACTVMAGCAHDSMSPYLNGCAQGYIPLLKDGTGSTQIDCISFCKPVDCTMGTGKCNRTGTVADGNALRGEAPYDCENAHHQGTFNTSVAGGNNGDQCFYSWAFEYDSQGNFHMSPTSDTLGYCIDHSKYQYDSNMDNMLGGSDAFWPRCDTLNVISGGSAFDSAFFGCVSTTTATAGGNPPLLRKKMLADFPRAPYHKMTRMN